jgi:hypothetical protein
MFVSLMKYTSIYNTHNAFYNRNATMKKGPCPPVCVCTNCGRDQCRCRLAEYEPHTGPDGFVFNACKCAQYSKPPELLQLPPPLPSPLELEREFNWNAFVQATMGVVNQDFSPMFTRMYKTVTFKLLEPKNEQACHIDWINTHAVAVLLYFQQKGKVCRRGWVLL